MSSTDWNRIAEQLERLLQLTPETAAEWIGLMQHWRFRDGSATCVIHQTELMDAIAEYAETLRSPLGFKPAVVIGNLKDHAIKIARARRVVDGDVWQTETPQQRRQRMERHAAYARCIAAWVVDQQPANPGDVSRAPELWKAFNAGRVMQQRINEKGHRND